MLRLIWNIRYALIAHKYLKCTWIFAWQMALAESEDMMELSPQEAFDEEMSYWRQDIDIGLLDG